MFRINRLPSPLPDHHPENSADSLAGFSDYFSYYHFHFPSAKHHSAGMIPGPIYSIWSQCWIPENPKGLVLLLHGYLDHSAMMMHAARYATERGYAAFVYDQPGHGLSEGPKVDIDNYSTYALHLQSVLDWIKSHFELPVNVIAHCNGAGIFLDYARLFGTEKTEKVVLLAPVIRHHLFKTAKTAHEMASTLKLRFVPNMSVNLSSDPDFNTLVWTDPLRPNWVPLSWASAYYKWVDEMEKTNHLPASACIIQGTNDTVVDAGFNIPYLQDRLSHTEVHWIEKGKHELHYEIEAIRTDVFQKVLKYMEAENDT